MYCVLLDSWSVVSRNCCGSKVPMMLLQVGLRMNCDWMPAVTSAQRPATLQRANPLPLQACSKYGTPHTLSVSDTVHMAVALWSFCCLLRFDYASLLLPALDDAAEVRSEAVCNGEISSLEVGSRSGG